MPCCWRATGAVCYWQGLFCVPLAWARESLFGASQCRGFADHANSVADCDVDLRLYYYFLWCYFSAEFFGDGIGVWVLRMREPDLPRPFKVPLYPLPLIVFAALSLWTLVHLFDQRPVEGAMALGLIVLGLLFYAVSRKLQTAQ